MKTKMNLSYLTLHEMDNLQAGYEALWSPKDGKWCGCGCYYAGPEGGSSTEANRNANYKAGLWSPEEP